MKRALVVVAGAVAGFAVAVAGCAATTPPPGWQQGGAPLFVPRATWVSNGASVELMPDGRVFVNGNPAFGIDPAGRVFDVDGQAIAMLRPDGRLVGSGNVDMGAVGATSAAEAGARYATLAIAASGQVLRYQDGEPSAAGGWTGCGTFAPALQACMLVTYMVITRYQPAGPFNRTGTTPYGTPFGTPIMSGFGLGIPIP
jgi:hypothetical protein